MAENVANQIARQLFAMSAKKRQTDLVENMRNERYQRTFTDEYPFAKKSRGGFRKVPAEQKKAWDVLASRK